MAKTIDRFKTMDGQPVTLVAANVFAVIPSVVETDAHRSELPDDAMLYEVISTGGYRQLVVQLKGDNIKQHVIEALE